ncbi:MAG: trypsin-like peptidase domain-containing protein [Thaumarchaeota archaeon]|nr:trypsin-like peptidase domain-containing protein [Nitrososphaerota archaeon]
MNLTEFEKQITDAVEKLSESVVSINSMKLAEDFRRGLIPVEGSGSGFIIDANGYIITNNHVVDSAARVQVNLKDGRSLTGEVIGSDPATDVAVIRVDTDNLPTADLADSDQIKVGQLVLAIGNALGLPGGHTVSSGVVSAVARPLPGADFIFEGLIQTDAAINPGNSGGPLADIRGNVIGINTAMIPFAQGVGFAIPINTVKRIAQQILEKGRVVRPWLGISGTDLNPAVARRYGISTDSGVLVAEIVPHSPAHEAGLRVGDTLTQMGPYRIGNMKDLVLALSKLPMAEVTLYLVRRGNVHRTVIRLLEQPAQMVNLGR